MPARPGSRQPASASSSQPGSIMLAQSSPHRGWIRRHPVLTGLWCVNAVVWLLAMTAAYDDDLLVSIAAFLILVAGGTLVVLGLGWIVDRVNGYHQPADMPDVALPDHTGSIGLTGSSWQAPVNPPMDETKQFDEELVESEAAQWRRLMRTRHAGAGHASQANAGVDTVVPSRSPAPSATATKADRFCPHCGLPFEGNELFCRQCGARRSSV